jgi:hypothetical protein
LASAWACTSASWAGRGRRCRRRPPHRASLLQSCGGALTGPCVCRLRTLFFFMALASVSAPRRAGLHPPPPAASCCMRCRGRRRTRARASAQPARAPPPPAAGALPGGHQLEQIHRQRAQGRRQLRARASCSPPPPLLLAASQLLELPRPAGTLARPRPAPPALSRQRPLAGGAACAPGARGGAVRRGAAAAGTRCTRRSTSSASPLAPSWRTPRTTARCPTCPSPWRAGAQA